MSKSILILVDGLRPDGLTGCKNSYVEELLNVTQHTLKARTIMPSVTLPCHMSLFHSVPSERHNTLTNTYVPQVRPVKGLFETLYNAGKKNASFYNWEELRDLSRPGHLHHSLYMSYNAPEDMAVSDKRLTQEALQYIKENNPDVVFLYLGVTDAAGHNNCWMSEAYMNAVSDAVDCIHQVIDSCSGDYNILVTADHGGHDRHHGSDIPEDMTIPILIKACDNTQFDLQDASIMDIAPTITCLAGVSPDPEWEGKSLIR